MVTCSRTINLWFVSLAIIYDDLLSKMAIFTMVVGHAHLGFLFLTQRLCWPYWLPLKLCLSWDVCTITWHVVKKNAVMYLLLWGFHLGADHLINGDTLTWLCGLEVRSAIFLGWFNDIKKASCTSWWLDLRTIIRLFLIFSNKISLWIQCFSVSSIVEVVHFLVISLKVAWCYISFDGGLGSKVRHPTQIWNYCALSDWLAFAVGGMCFWFPSESKSRFSLAIGSESKSCFLQYHRMSGSMMISSWVM